MSVIGSVDSAPTISPDVRACFAVNDAFVIGFVSLSPVASTRDSRCPPRLLCKYPNLCRVPLCPARLGRQGAVRRGTPRGRTSRRSRGRRPLRRCACRIVTTDPRGLTFVFRQALTFRGHVHATGTFLSSLPNSSSFLSILFQISTVALSSFFIPLPDAVLSLSLNIGNHLMLLCGRECCPRTHQNIDA